MQHQTRHPAKFEITYVARDSLQVWIRQTGLKPEDFLFLSHLDDSPHPGMRQYPRILGHWVGELDLDRMEYEMESTVMYQGIEVDVVLEISEQTDIEAASEAAAGWRSQRLQCGAVLTH